MICHQALPCDKFSPTAYSFIYDILIFMLVSPIWTFCFSHYIGRDRGMHFFIYYSYFQATFLPNVAYQADSIDRTEFKSQCNSMKKNVLQEGNFERRQAKMEHISGCFLIPPYGLINGWGKLQQRGTLPIVYVHSPLHITLYTLKRWSGHVFTSFTSHWYVIALSGTCVGSIPEYFIYLFIHLFIFLTHLPWGAPSPP